MNIIFAGHYCVGEESQELGSQAFAENKSWKLGVKKYSEDPRNSKLVLWINDIGISQNVRKILKNDYEIPDEYKAILNEHGVPDRDVLIEFESTIRNKASGQVKKINQNHPSKISKVPSDKGGLLRCVDNEQCDIHGDVEKWSYVIDGPNNEELVIKDGPNPKCNLILATLFKKYVNEGDEVTLYFNGVYMKRISLGVYVYKSLMGGMKIFNSHFIDFKGNELFKVY